MCAQLAASTGLVVATGGRPAGAMLLLVDLRVQVRQRHDVRLHKTPRLHQRGLATAVLEVAGARFGVASMHLSLDDAERSRQAAEVLGHIHRLDAPSLVLAGDVNESPTGPSWQTLSKALTDAYAAAPWDGEFTMSAVRPTRRIDGIFVSPTVEVVRCGVPEHLPGVRASDLVRATDHRPVLADLLIPTTPDAS